MSDLIVSNQSDLVKKDTIGLAPCEGYVQSVRSLMAQDKYDRIQRYIQYVRDTDNYILLRSGEINPETKQNRMFYELRSSDRWYADGLSEFVLDTGLSYPDMQPLQQNLLRMEFTSMLRSDDFYTYAELKDLINVCHEMYPEHRRKFMYKWISIINDTNVKLVQDGPTVNINRDNCTGVYADYLPSEIRTSDNRFYIGNENDSNSAYIHRQLKRVEVFESSFPKGDDMRLYLVKYWGWQYQERGDKIYIPWQVHCFNSYYNFSHKGIWKNIGEDLPLKDLFVAAQNRVLGRDNSYLLARYGAIHR